MVFRKAKLAIFVHGCYWHQCPHCQRNRSPKTNAAYWSAKFQANQARDARNQSALESLGYQVLVIWECQIQKSLTENVERIRLLVDKDRAPPLPHRELRTENFPLTLLLRAPRTEY